VPSHWPESPKCDNADPTIDSTSAEVGYELPATDWQKSSKINKPTGFLGHHHVTASAQLSCTAWISFDVPES